MADETIKSLIDSTLPTNDNGDITAEVLRDLQKAIVDYNSNGYLFTEVVTPSSTNNATDQKIYAIASQNGSYPEFDSIVLSNEIALLKYDGSNWVKDSLIEVVDSISGGGVLNQIASTLAVVEKAQQFSGSSFLGDISTSDSNPFSVGVPAYVLPNESGTYSNLDGSPVIDLTTYPISYLSYDGTTTNVLQYSVDLTEYIKIVEASDLYNRTIPNTYSSVSTLVANGAIEDSDTKFTIPIGQTGKFSQIGIYPNWQNDLLTDLNNKSIKLRASFKVTNWNVLTPTRVRAELGGIPQTDGTIVYDPISNTIIAEVEINASVAYITDTAYFFFQNRSDDVMVSEVTVELYDFSIRIVEFSQTVSLEGKENYSTKEQIKYEIDRNETIENKNLLSEAQPLEISVLTAGGAELYEDGFQIPVGQTGYLGGLSFNLSNLIEGYLDTTVNIRVSANVSCSTADKTAILDDDNWIFPKLSGNDIDVSNVVLTITEQSESSGVEQLILIGTFDLLVNSKLATNLRLTNQYNTAISDEPVLVNNLNYLMKIVDGDEVTKNGAQYEALINTLDRYLRVINDKPTYTTKSVSATGADGVDADFAGNSPTQRALNSIKDHFIVNNANRFSTKLKQGVYKAEVESDYNEYLNSFKNCIIAGKDYIDVIGEGALTTIVYAYLPDNLPEETYEKYQAIFWDANKAVLAAMSAIAENCRYPVHIEGNINANYDFQTVIRDMIIEHKGNTGNAFNAWKAWYPIGYGAQSGQNLLVLNCILRTLSVPHDLEQSVVYVHTDEELDRPIDITYQNCRLEAEKGKITLDNFASLCRNSLKMLNCEFDNRIFLRYTQISSDKYKSSNHNSFDVEFDTSPIPVRVDELKGRTLLFKSLSTSAPSSIRFSRTSDLFDILGNEELSLPNSATMIDNNTHTLIHGYGYKDGGDGLQGYGFGLTDLQETSISNPDGGNVSLKDRLGNLSGVGNSKDLIVTIDDVDRTITFNIDFSSMSNTDIAAWINTEVSAWATCIEVNGGRWEYPRFRGNKMRTNKDAVAIEKGMGLIYVGYDGVILAKSTDNKIDAIAMDDAVVDGKLRTNSEGRLYDRDNDRFHCILQNLSSNTVNDYYGIDPLNDGVFKANEGIPLLRIVDQDFYSNGTSTRSMVVEFI